MIGAGRAKRIILTALVACLLLFLPAGKAMAQCTQNTCGFCGDPISCQAANCFWDLTQMACSSTPPVCTVNFNPPLMGAGEAGIFSSIVTQLITVLNNLAKNMFLGITNNPASGFQTVIAALVTLYIIVYGVLFTFGMVQITLFDFVMRIVKLSIVATLLNGGLAWQYFSETVIPFFQGSTYVVINWMTSIVGNGMGLNVGCNAVVVTNGQPNPACATPFAVLDAVIGNAVSANMLVLMVTTITTLPYGPIIGLMLLFATGKFLKMVVTGLWVYAMSLIMQTLLFGLAPIFIAFMLFNRTRHLFDGWLNQLVNSLLQPVLLFTFLAFFVTLIGECINLLLSYPICQARLPTILAGTPMGMTSWRFVLQGDPPTTPANGVQWGFNGPTNVVGQPVFPIPILLILVYWVLVDLCDRFVEVCIDIAKNLAGASTDLRMGMESMGSWLNNAMGGGGGGGSSGGIGDVIKNMVGGGSEGGKSIIDTVKQALGAGGGGGGTPRQPTRPGNMRMGPGAAPGGKGMAGGPASGPDWRAPGAGGRTKV